MPDPIPPIHDPNRFAPIFVLAPARSYTSVISTMLGQHPDLAALPELKLFSYATLGELEASLPSFWIERGVTHRSPGLVRAVAELLFGGQTSELVECARAWLQDRAHWLGTNVLDMLMECLQPRICVEKSPENVETNDALERVAMAYPRGRYLHLTRHPVTTQRSIRAHLNRILPGYGDRGQPVAGIAAWYETHRRILQFAAKLPGDRYMRVRAEDVLNDMGRQLESIAAWLGLHTDARAIENMRNTEASPFARPGPASTGIIGGNDPAFLNNPIPHPVQIPNTVDLPSGWSEEPSAWEMVVDLARELGYG